MGLLERTNGGRLPRSAFEQRKDFQLGMMWGSVFFCCCCYRQVKDHDFSILKAHPLFSSSCKTIQSARSMKDVVTRTVKEEFIIKSIEPSIMYGVM